MRRTTVPGILCGILILLGVLASCSPEPATTVTVTVTQHTDPSGITGIARYNGYIYCATRGGLVRWDLDTREYALITTAEGLISNVLTDVAVDSDSILWISSREGLTSFDGSAWKRYGIADGLPSTYITDLTTDREGTLWVSTRDGAAWHSGSRFSLLAEEGSPGRKPITAVFFDQGNNIWVSTESDGVYRRNEGEWTRRIQDNGRIAQSGDLNIWIYNDEVVGFWNGVSFSQYATIENMSAIGARCITSTSDRLWFFTANGVHASYGASDWWHFTEAEGLASNDVTAGLVISDDEVYAGTANGLSVIRNGIVDNYVVPNTPVGYNSIAVAADSLGRIWLGTWEQGTNLYENGLWTIVSGSARITERLKTVRSFVFGPGGETVFNTTTGILFNDDRGWRVETRSTGVSGDDVRCGVFDLEGRYWAGTAAGICCLENGAWTRFREYHGLPSEDTWACASGADGTVWFGTTRGIVSFDGLQMSIRTAETGLDSLDVRSACTSGSTVWFGTADGKLIAFGDTSCEVYGNAMLGTNRAIHAIAAEPSGALWLGTDGDGIIRFDNGRVEHYTVDDGIPYDVVRALAFDNGVLWLACYGGAAALTRADTP